MGEIVHGSGQIICEPGTGAFSPVIPIRKDGGNLPLVSIVIPTWCEERYIADCLHSILAQDYPVSRMEILVVDGMSPDRTREIVKRIGTTCPQIRLLDNPERLQAAGLNRAISMSRGNFILRIDAHAEYASDYVRTCVETLRETGADNVGGPQLPKARTFFQKMVAFALHSPLGTGGAPCRSEGKDGYVDTVFPGAFRRQTLQRVGLFDPGAITNEDAEINQRIIASGGRIYLNSAIKCFYYPRESLRGLARQYFRYGRGRARTVLKHGQFLRLGSFLPFAFFTGLLCLLLLGLFWTPGLWLAAAAAGMYAAGIIAEGARMAIKHQWACAFMLPLVFVTLHLSHAVGVAWGLLYYSSNPDWIHLNPPLLQQ
ncbi:MAG TPA: glycosyltransferase family 2 protein [Planctomycetota bacterium]|jgi:cellulose synthase/poly-beta-1,6-N-acetylglucosamine synthase-like glycosyltransferase